MRPSLVIESKVLPLMGGTFNFKESGEMNSRVNRLLVMLLIIVMTGVVAFAKGKKETVTFAQDLKVNGTVVKKGTYAVTFDDQTSELSILKNGKVIAKAPARVEQRENKARHFELRSTGSGENAELTGVAFGGSEQNIVLTPSAAKSN